MGFIPLAIKPQSDIQLETTANLKNSEDLEKNLRIEQNFRTVGASNKFLLKSLLPYGTYNTLGSISEIGQEKLTADEANVEFGIPGRIQFKESVTRQAAEKTHNDAIRAQQVDDYLARASQSNNLGDKTGNLLLGLGVQSLDAFNYIPFFDLLKIYKFGKAGLAVNNVLKSPIARAGVDATIGNIAEQPIIAQANQDLGIKYDLVDGLIDVGLGTTAALGLSTVFHGFRANSVLKTREYRAERFAQQTQMTKDSFARLVSFTEESAARGTDPVLDVVRSIIKLGDTMDTNRKIAPGGFYLNDLVYRGDFDSMSKDHLDIVHTQAMKESLIPESRFASFDRAFNLLDEGPHRLNELSGDLSQLVQKIGSRNGFITIRDFTDLLSEKGGFNIGDIGTKKFIQEVTGYKGKIKPGTSISAKQAYALYDAIQEKLRTTKVKLNTDTIPLLKKLQSELKALKDNADVSFETFKQRFNSAKRAIDARPDLRKADIFELQKMNQADQDIIKNYLKFYQMGNPTGEQANRLMRGSLDGVRELYEQTKFNSQTKDSISLEEAHNKIENHIKDQMAVKKPGVANDILGLDVKSESDMSLTDAYLNEQLRSYEKLLPEEDVKRLNQEVDQEVASHVDAYIEGLKEAIQCSARARQ
jgi:hypothetical protein